MARRRRSGSGSAPRRKFLINAREASETRVAILSGKSLEDHALERESLGSILGNIYKARVTNVEKSIGAAFVDFGGQKQGFLHVSDLCTAAVGDEARALLVNVQAARESAHDEDVVDGDTAPSGEDVPAEAADEAGTEGADEASAPPARAPRELEAGTEGGEEGVGRQRVAVRTLDEAPVAGTGEARTGDEGTGDDTTREDETSEEDEADRADAARRKRSRRRDEDDEDEDDEDEDEDEDERMLAHAGFDEDDREDEADVELVNPAEELDVPSSRDGDEADEADEADERTGDEDDDDDRDASGARARRPRRRAAPAREDDVGDRDDERTPGRDDDSGDDRDGDEDDEDGDGEDGEGKRRRGRRRRGRRGRGRKRRSGDGEATEDEARTTKTASADGASGSGKNGKNGKNGRRRRGRRREGRELPEIEQILRRGDEIVVQAIKDGIGTKGPTMTSFLAIPGRYVVLMPGIAKRGVSRKILDNGERDRLKALVRKLEVPEGLGFVVRTAGVGKRRDDLQRDLDYLLRLWAQLQVRVREHSAPVLLYQENDLVIRTLRDYYDGEGEIVVDDPETAEQVRSFMATIMPECVDKVQLYEGEKPLFTAYGLEAELDKLLHSRIELKSGGTLVIEQTEALVAIDVNSGRARFEGGIDETAFQVNAEAAVEIARQIRLRDLGGVVVVDFIDMRTEKKRKQLESLFREELRKDRARIKMARFSPFGIIELTRQRVRPSLKRSVHERCPYCSGTGYIPSDETSCLAVVRRIREQLVRPGAALIVTVRPEVAEAVLNEHREELLSLEAESHKRIYVRSDHRLAYEDVEVRPMLTLPTMDHRRA